MHKHSGYLYFYLHFVTEIVCFYLLSQVIGDKFILWMVPFLYDFLAFVPQALFGFLNDKFKSLPLVYAGLFLLALSLALFSLTNLNIFLIVILLSLGNAFVHVAGAETTLRSNPGHLSPVAIFVAGGSFGVVTGRLLARIAPFWFILLLILSALPIAYLAESILHSRDIQKSWSNPHLSFHFHNESLPLSLLVILTVFVVITRSYMGYGIPTSWNKTTPQLIALYVFMGLGKALGGILIDKIGMKKTAILSVVGALPFLLFGNNLMWLSLIGVLLFSMTMAVTLGLLVSALPRSPGLAFGFTTIGLFLGAAPIFFFTIDNLLVNCLIIIILSLLCLIILLKIIKEPPYAKAKK